MKHLKVNLSVPEEALEKIKKQGRPVSDSVREIAQRYLHENIPTNIRAEKKVTIGVSLPYDLLKQIRKREKAKIFLERAVAHWAKEEEVGRN